MMDDGRWEMDDGIDLTQQVIGIGHRGGLGGSGLVDGKGREAEGLMLAEGIEGAHAAVLAATALGDEEAVLEGDG